MEHFIDDLGKRLANAVSRRDMLSITARTFSAAFLSSTGIGKLWASSNANPNSTQVCPSCGTCQQCNTKAAKCGQDCENPCTAAVLCPTAQQFPPYVTLQSFLSDQFTFASEPQALVLIEPSVAQATVLSTTYTGADPSVTANLYFTETSAGYSAYALTYSNGAPQFGYFVAANGQLQQVLPPYQLSLSPSSASTTVNRDSSTSTIASAKGASNACSSSCDLLCNSAGKAACAVLVTAVCAELVVALPAAAICGLVLGGICETGLTGACPNICKGFCGCPVGQQSCPSGCCGACQICSNGQCVPNLCLDGYSCSNGALGTDATGIGLSALACTCTNFCGTTCCSSGQTCMNDQCVASCPSNTIACGAACCSSGQTCTSGQCVTSTCPAGYVTCGSGGGCCNPGEVCCINPFGQPGCGPVGTYCCSTGFGACPIGTTCCGVFTGPTSFENLCCPSGTTCCISGENASCLGPGSTC